MKLGRTVVFVFLFVVVTALYVYQKRLAKEALTSSPDEVNRSVVLSSEDVIERIDLRDHIQKTEIVLVKTKGVWLMESPVRFPVEQGIVEGLATAARIASRQPRLQAEKEWAEYGLEKPDIEVTFSLPRERTEMLLLGSLVPVGKAVFARWKSERGYFLLPPEMKAMFQQSVYGLREKRVFRAPAEAIRKVSIEMGVYSCQWKRDGGVWYWMEPVSKFGQKMSNKEMAQVWQTLLNLHAKEFLDNNRKSRAELGFFMIHDRVRVESEGFPTEALQFGNELPERNAYYAFLEGENTIFLVDRVNVIALFDLMKKHCPELPEDEPDAVTV